MAGRGKQPSTGSMGISPLRFAMLALSTFVLLLAFCPAGINAQAKEDVSKRCLSLTSEC